MYNFHLLLTRSHYTSLVIGAADVASNPQHDESPGVNGFSWFTRFDGGQSTHTPSDFVALYGETVDGEPNDEARPLDDNVEMYALVEVEAWSQRPDRTAHRFFRHKSPYPKMKRDGLNLAEAAFTACFSWDRKELAADVRPWDWETVEENEVPELARRTLVKTIKVMRGLFGQGGDFFK